MSPVPHSVARSRDLAGNIAFISKASGRSQTAAQKAVAPLAPIFAACSARGLVINDANREVRLRAVNRYLDFLPFDWIETSFKELLGDTAAIVVIADAIQAGCLSW